MTTAVVVALLMLGIFVLAGGIGVFLRPRLAKHRAEGRRIRKVGKADRRIFCKDCKYYKVSDASGVRVELCLVSWEQVDPVEGVQRLPSSPRIRNANLDCPDHTPHGAERIRRGSRGS